MDVPNVGPLMGITAGLVWRGFETWSQISMRNRVRAIKFGMPPLAAVPLFFA